jgi:hypothetical protein
MIHYCGSAYKLFMNQNYSAALNGYISKFPEEQKSPFTRLVPPPPNFKIHVPYEDLILRAEYDKYDE